MCNLGHLYWSLFRYRTLAQSRPLVLVIVRIKNTCAVYASCTGHCSNKEHIVQSMPLVLVIVQIKNMCSLGHLYWSLFRYRTLAQSRPLVLVIVRIKNTCAVYASCTSHCSNKEQFLMKFDASDPDALKHH